MGITNEISQALLDVAIAHTTCKLGYRNAVPNTYTKKFPFWTAWPFQQEYDFASNVEVGATIERPSFWIIHYIIHTDINAAIDVNAAHERMLDDVDSLHEAWGDKNVLTLFNGTAALVTTSGDRRTWKHNPDGPFVQFGGRMVMGSYGLFSVVPPTIPFGCNP